MIVGVLPEIYRNPLIDIPVEKNTFLAIILNPKIGCRDIMDALSVKDVLFIQVPFPSSKK
jgi:hypothetical protein